MALSELAALRVAFTLATARLINKAKALGYMPALNEVKRSNEQAIINALGQVGRAHVANVLSGARWYDLAAAIVDNGAANGIRNSLHEVGLAADLLLYRPTGEYLTRTEDYQALGEWWEMAYPGVSAWGGRFGDAGHFSFQYGGKK